MEWREERGRRRDDEVQSEGAAHFLPVALQSQLTPRVKTVTHVAPRTRGVVVGGRLPSQGTKS